MAQPIDSDDLAATLTAFAISFTAAMQSGPRSPNEMLRKLAEELGDFADKMNDTAAGEALRITMAMLNASDPDEE